MTWSRDRILMEIQEKRKYRKEIDRAIRRPGADVPYLATLERTLGEEIERLKEELDDLAAPQPIAFEEAMTRLNQVLRTGKGNQHKYIELPWLTIAQRDYMSYRATPSKAATYYAIRFASTKKLPKLLAALLKEELEAAERFGQDFREAFRFINTFIEEYRPAQVDDPPMIDLRPTIELEDCIRIDVALLEGIRAACISSDAKDFLYAAFNSHTLVGTARKIPLEEEARILEEAIAEEERQQERSQKLKLVTDYAGCLRRLVTNAQVHIVPRALLARAQELLPTLDLTLADPTDTALATAVEQTAPVMEEVEQLSRDLTKSIRQLHDEYWALRSRIEETGQGKHGRGAPNGFRPALTEAAIELVTRALPIICVAQSLGIRELGSGEDLKTGGAILLGKLGHRPVQLDSMGGVATPSQGERPPLAKLNSLSCNEEPTREVTTGTGNEADGLGWALLVGVLVVIAALVLTTVLLNGLSQAASESGYGAAQAIVCAA